MSEVACILQFLNVLIQFLKSIELFNYKVQYNIGTFAEDSIQILHSESEGSVQKSDRLCSFTLTCIPAL